MASNIGENFEKFVIENILTSIATGLKTNHNLNISTNDLMSYVNNNNNVIKCQHTFANRKGICGKPCIDGEELCSTHHKQKMKNNNKKKTPELKMPTQPNIDPLDIINNTKKHCNLKLIDADKNISLYNDTNLVMLAHKNKLSCIGYQDTDTEEIHLLNDEMEELAKSHNLNILNKENAEKILNLDTKGFNNAVNIENNTRFSPKKIVGIPKTPTKETSTTPVLKIPELPKNNIPKISTIPLIPNSKK